jgi:hypothetical protein
VGQFALPQFTVRGAHPDHRCRDQDKLNHDALNAAEQRRLSDNGSRGTPEQEA